MAAESGRAVVLLSGGLDSATALAWACERGYQCYALSVAYGQRHDAELAAAARVARALGAAEHRVMHVDLGSLGGSALTDTAIAVPENGGTGIPVTYVPARNTVLLSLSLAWAEVLGAMAIVIGVNAVDYSGYPEAAVEGQSLNVLAPLLRMSKAEIVREGLRLDVDYALTVSCYQADGEGRACGRCDACRLRREGFEAAGVADPTRYA